MQRYHVKTGFADIEALKDVTTKLNAMNWKYTKHCINNIKLRIGNIKDVLNFIKDINLKYKYIFEYYKAEGIEKICYRIPYNYTFDIILILNKDKVIITIYLNNKTDSHITLNKKQYTKI